MPLARQKTGRLNEAGAKVGQREPSKMTTCMGGMISWVGGGGYFGYGREECPFGATATRLVGDGAWRRSCRRAGRGFAWWGWVRRRRRRRGRARVGGRRPPGRRRAGG